MKTDFKLFYNLDNYLYEVVTKKFKKDGYLSAVDFFCIVIWKANRSKTKIARKLVKRGHSDLDEAIKELTSKIANQKDNKEKLRVLVDDWKFRLPMSTAILAVLYPSEFSVYDYRVCESLGQHNDVLKAKTFDQLWDRYSYFLKDVKEAGPESLSLKDKDCYLWGMSFYNQLVTDVKGNFKK